MKKTSLFQTESINVQESIGFEDKLKLHNIGVEEVICDKNLGCREYVYDKVRKILYAGKNMYRFSSVLSILEEKIKNEELEGSANLVMIDGNKNKIIPLPDNFISAYESSNHEKTSLFQTVIINVQESIGFEDKLKLHNIGVEEVKGDKHLGSGKYVYDKARKVLYADKGVYGFSDALSILEEKTKNGELECSANLVMIDGNKNKIIPLPDKYVLDYEDSGCKELGIFQTEIINVQESIGFENMAKLHSIGVKEVKGDKHLGFGECEYYGEQNILYCHEDVVGFSYMLDKLEQKINSREIEDRTEYHTTMVYDSEKHKWLFLEFEGIDPDIFSKQKRTEMCRLGLKKIKRANIYYEGCNCLYDGTKKELLIEEGCDENIIGATVDTMKSKYKKFGMRNSFVWWTKGARYPDKFCEITPPVGDIHKKISRANLLRMSEKGVRNIERIEGLLGKFVCNIKTGMFFVPESFEDSILEKVISSIPEKRKEKIDLTGSDFMVFNEDGNEIAHNEDDANISRDAFIISALARIKVWSKNGNIYVDKNGNLSHDKKSGKVLTTSDILRNMLTIYDELPEELKLLFFEQLISAKYNSFGAYKEGSGVGGFHSSKKEKNRLYYNTESVFLHEQGHAIHIAKILGGEYCNIYASSTLTNAAKTIVSKYYDIIGKKFTPEGEKFKMCLSLQDKRVAGEIVDSFVCLVEALGGGYISDFAEQYPGVHGEGECNCSEPYANLNPCIFYSHLSSEVAKPTLKAFVMFMPELVEAYVKEILGKDDSSESCEIIKKRAGLEEFEEIRNLLELSSRVRQEYDMIQQEA